MFLLARPAPYRMKRPPLAQALVQVRFPLVAELATLAGVAPLQERLRERYPIMNRRQQMAAQVGTGPAGPALRIEEGAAWELSDEEGRRVVVDPGSVTFSVGAAYGEASDFATRFEEVLDVVGEVARPARADRLGTRYLSVAESPPGGAGSWKAWFRPELTGWVAANICDEATALEVALSQVQLRGKPNGTLAEVATEVAAAIQHGLVPAGSGVPGVPPVTTSAQSYVLSLDLSFEAAQSFSPPALRGQFEALHQEIDAFFRWSLTRQGEEHFGLEEYA